MFLKMKLNVEEKSCFTHIAKQQKNFLYRNVITCKLFAFIKPTCDKIIAKHTYFKTHYRFV